MKPNVVTVLIYFLGIIGGVIFLLVEPYNKDQQMRFHSWQSILLGASYFVLSIAMAILGNIVSVLGLLSIPISLGLFAIWIFLMIRSYQGITVKLPIIGECAEKFAAK